MNFIGRIYDRLKHLDDSDCTIGPPDGLSEQQRKLDASVSPAEAREYVRKESERNANRGKPEPVSRDGFINDYD